MSDLKYLQIDSNYRNRNSYPNQSSFVVKSNTSNLDSLGDPISEDAPLKSWINFENKIFKTLNYNIKNYKKVIFVSIDITNFDNILKKDIKNPNFFKGLPIKISKDISSDTSSYT
tara:strand:- start:441 stop:785 length:345 start_codon:yes stop_codon:yes gene_type:complete